MKAIGSSIILPGKFTRDSKKYVTLRYEIT